ncbi:MAG TPA: type II secretion system F family protein [Terriglobales bacterium]|jgi:tight adherence protein B|nr:type II secretion system F family protein [Terriglobales bacterium]
MMLLATLGVLLLALGGGYYAFAGGGGVAAKRIDAIAKPTASGRSAKAPADAALKRKNVQAMLKEIESKSAEQKKKITMRQRLEQAGFPNVQPRTFYLISAAAALVVGVMCLLTRQSLLVTVLVAFAIGLGLPRWVLSFLKARREKAFTNEFANAIDVIVRSVKSGLPTNEALRIVAREVPDPCGMEFNRLCEGLKVGVTLEQGVKKMYESMPTAEVAFFGIVMTIQQKSGGNLSEALGNLSAVLRDRKRLLGKIKAMSSEAKASAMIIGSLPPGVMGIVYVTTPDYISLLFTEHMGNLMLAGCAIWMGLGIFVMRKMINFKS